MLKDHSLKSNTKEALPSAVEMIVVGLEGLSERELIDVRHKLDVMLQLDLGSLDLAEELALQYRQAKALLNEVQNDSDTPANQKSQLFNSTRAQLGDIIKQQEAVWSMERLKKFEVAFKRALEHESMTAEARAVFFDLYGMYLKDASV